VRELFDLHRGHFKISKSDLTSGNISNLSTIQMETIDSVLAYYGDKSSQWLSDLTHLESPWREARDGLPPNENGYFEITPASMMEYYSSLPIGS
jgi:uncharacterized phage-associated protein